MPTESDLPHRPVTAATLRKYGVGRHRLSRLVRDGVLRRITSGVYVRADVADSVELRAQAVSLVIRPHQVVCDRTAAWIWGIDAYAYADLDEPPIEVVALRGNSPCTRQAVRGRTRDLASTDVTTVAGLQVTTPLRTALDLGCILHRRDALAALDAFRRAHGLSIEELRVGAQRYRRRRGVVQLRDLVPHSDPRAESTRESWTRLAIIDAGLPLPEPQVWVDVDGVPTYRLDLAYRRRRIAVEYDGWEAHERTTEQREYDAERRAWLRRHGWTVIVVRKGDFTGEGLARWTTELGEALRSSYSNRRRLERSSRA